MELAQSVLDKLGFDWQVALANLVNFLIIYFLLKKVVFDKLADAINERKQKAQANVALRSELDQEKASLEIFKESQAQELFRERTAVLSQAQKQKQEILTEAEQQARFIAQKAEADAEKEKEKIIASVGDDIKELSVSLSEKILADYQEKPDTAKIKTLLNNNTK